MLSIKSYAMTLITISLLAGLAGFSFVKLAPWPFVLKGKPFNCQTCMAFWFGLIFYLCIEISPLAVLVGFASMYVSATAQKQLEK